MKKILLLFAVLTTAILSAQNVPSYVPTNGLVGWWPFDGNANDQSGNGNNGTVYGASLTSDRNGNSNAAYEFDGSNDYISVNDTTSLSTSNSNGLTISCWIKNDQIWTSPRWLYIISKSNQTGGWNFNGGYILRAGADGGAPFNYVPLLETTSGEYNFNSTTYIDSTWELITLTYDNDEAKLYRNGVLDITYTLPNGQIINSTEDLVFGAASNGSTHFFEGTIDDIGIWNRALDSAEINILYNNCQDSLLAQPSSSTFQTIPGTAHFTTAHSDTSATYQWQQNTGTGWTNLSDFGIYSGTTTDSLVLTGITTSLNGYGYRCIIDACTMDTTDVAFLTVVDNVGIDEDEATITIAPNPTSGTVTIGLNSAAEYKVFNVNGQVVAKGKTDGQIDLTNLPSGSYQLILDSEDGSTVHSIQKI